MHREMDTSTKKTVLLSRLKGLREGISLILASRVATIGLGLVLFWVLAALVSLFWTPYSPNAIDFDPNLPTNASHWLGTDHMGRDILSRLMKGTQVVLLKTRLPWGRSPFRAVWPSGVCSVLWFWVRCSASMPATDVAIRTRSSCRSWMP